MSVTRFTSIPGNLFDAGVALPTPAPAKTTPSKQPSDLILRELVDLASHVQGDFRRHALELAARRDALNKECAALRTRLIDEIEKGLAQRWENAKLACSNMQCEIANAEGRITELQREMNRVNETVLGPALANQQTAHAERANASRFSPAAAIKKLDAAILTAASAVEKAQKEVAILQQEINGIVTVTLPRLGEKFKKLSTEERRLCGLITGQVFADEITGLPMLPART